MLNRCKPYLGNCMPQLSSKKVKYPDQNCLKAILVIKVATMKETDDSYYKKEVITSKHQIITFYCQQR